MAAYFHLGFHFHFYFHFVCNSVAACATRSPLAPLTGRPEEEVVADRCAAGSGPSSSALANYYYHYYDCHYRLSAVGSAGKRTSSPARAPLASVGSLSLPGGSGKVSGEAGRLADWIVLHRKWPTPRTQGLSHRSAVWLIEQLEQQLVGPIQCRRGSISRGCSRALAG